MFSRSLEKIVIYLFPSILLSKNEGMSSSVAVCDRCKYSCAHAQHTHAHSLRENACVCVLMAGEKGRTCTGTDPMHSSQHYGYGYFIIKEAI